MRSDGAAKPHAPRFGCTMGGELRQRKEPAAGDEPSSWSPVSTGTPASAPSPASSSSSVTSARYGFRRKERVSFLDHVDPRSRLAQSAFWGFSNLAMMCCIMFVTSEMVNHYYKYGIFVYVDLFVGVFGEMFLLCSVWVLCSLWSLTAFMIQQLFLRFPNTPKWVVSILKHMSQATLISFSIGICTWFDVPIIPAAFILATASVYFMKMHSYVSTCFHFHQARRDNVPAAMCRLYPEAMTLKNFCHYLFCPVLVYEPEYPRATHPFRLGYFFKKLALLIGAFLVTMIISSNYIFPHALESYTFSFVASCARLLMPFFIVAVLVFYIVFECSCNILAELTGFGDRNFYEDWWNSTTYEEFSRKWNRPVHEFLLRHVYMEMRSKLRLSRRLALTVTLVFSALMHEMCLAVCFRMIRFWMALLMMVQLPLMFIAKYHEGTAFGNAFFWFGIILGLPLLGVIYCREWSAILADNKSSWDPFRII